MSTQNANPQDGSRAIKAQAVEWLERSERKQFGEDEQRQLEQWLAQSPGHRVAFWHAKAAWERSGRLQALRPRPASGASRGEARKGWPLLARSAAAAAAVLGLVSAGAIWMSAPRDRTLTTAHGEREIVSLADGSKIELNTDTEVRVGTKAGQRIAELVRGEAYFQVEHDAAHPFTVLAGDHRIRDLGTKFLVRKSPTGLRVALVEGRAQLEPASNGSGQKPVVLNPGDVAIANANGIVVSLKPTHELADDLAWRHGGLVFHNASLADAVAQFNRYGNVKLVVTDPAAAKLTINGAFRAAGAENFAGVAHEIFGLRVERRENEIVLSR